MTLVQDLSLPQLPLARYRLHFTVTDTARLPDYAGSAWRGVFGRSLKRLVCVTREPVCDRCLLYRSCVYPYVFEGGVLNMEFPLFTRISQTHSD